MDKAFCDQYLCRPCSVFLEEKGSVLPGTFETLSLLSKDDLETLIWFVGQIPGLDAENDPHLLECPVRPFICLAFPLTSHNFVLYTGHHAHTRAMPSTGLCEEYTYIPYSADLVHRTILQVQARKQNLKLPPTLSHATNIEDIATAMRWPVNLSDRQQALKRYTDISHKD